MLISYLEDGVFFAIGVLRRISLFRRFLSFKYILQLYMNLLFLLT
jgi:hypothetical protein